MHESEIHERLKRMGFAKVDGAEGWRGDFKWRHRSAFGTQYHGSVWVHPRGEIRANGKPSRGGYESRFVKWAKPTDTDNSLSNPFSVWTGPDVAKLLEAMENRITPTTIWPPKT